MSCIVSCPGLSCPASRPGSRLSRVAATISTRPQEGGGGPSLVMTRERKWQEQAEAIRLASRMTVTSKPLVDLSPDSELPTAAGTQCSSSRIEQKRSRTKWLMGVMQSWPAKGAKRQNPTQSQKQSRWRHHQSSWRKPREEMRRCSRRCLGKQRRAREGERDIFHQGRLAALPLATQGQWHWGLSDNGATGPSGILPKRRHEAGAWDSPGRTHG